MNKKLLYCAIAAFALAGSLCSCSNDDEPDNKPTVKETLQGMYVVNNGNQSGNIPGSITSYDYATGKASQDVFYSANNYSVGDMPQSAIVYGSKIYIAVAKSNLLWICDANNLKVLGNVKFEGDYSEPRYLTSYEGKVYVSLYSGHVAEIDTLSMKMARTVKVGPNPEQMAVAGGRLYVANSDGMNWQEGYKNGYVSVVNLADMAESRLDIALNPVDMLSNGNDVVVLCKGDYGAIPSQVYKISGGKGTMICDASYIALRGDELYVINYPYSKDPAQQIKAYDVYSVKTGKKIRDMVSASDQVSYPSGLNVDPVSGNIVILSYTLSAEGYAQYREPCYAQIYDNNGKPLARFDTGVGSTWVTFLHHSEIIP